MHPFNKLLAFLPLTIILPILLWTDKTRRSLAVLAVILAVFAIFELGMISAVKRLRPQEERDIVEFLLGLLPGARSL